MFGEGEGARSSYLVTLNNTPHSLIMMRRRGFTRLVEVVDYYHQRDTLTLIGFNVTIPKNGVRSIKVVPIYKSKRGLVPSEYTYRLNREEWEKFKKMIKEMGFRETQIEFGKLGTYIKLRRE